MPRIWALRCLQQAFSPISHPTGSLPSRRAGSPAGRPSDCDQSPAARASACTPPALLPPSLVWPHLPRLCQALCERGLPSASPAARSQACTAAGTLLGALCWREEGGAPALSSLLEVGELQGAAGAGAGGASPHTYVMEGCVGSRSAGAAEAAAGLGRLAEGLLGLARGDARVEVACTALRALEALLGCAHTLHSRRQRELEQQQQQQRQHSSSEMGSLVAGVLRQAAGILQQGGDAELVGCAQRLLSSGRDAWPGLEGTAAETEREAA